MKSTVAYLSSQQYRRDAMGLLASHAGLGMLGWLLLLPALVGGWLAGQQAAVLGLAALSLANTAFRRRVARPQGQEDARLVRQERLLQASALCTGLVWTLCNLLLYPLLPLPWAVAHLMALSGAAAVAALVLGWVRHLFVLAVLPMLASLALASLWLSQAPGWPVALAALPLGALLLLVAHRQRLHAASLALRQSQQAAAIHAAVAAERDRAEARLDASARLLATLSHELRTPMNGLLGTLSLLDRSPLDAHQRHLVGLAHSSGLGLMALLNDALDLARIDADRLVLRPVAASPQALAEAAVALFQAGAQAKGLQLQLRLAGPVPAAVLVDAQRLRQVLLNLLSNAVKYTDQGRISLGLTSASLPQQRVALNWVVQDSGIGIAADALGQLFQPFAQLHDDRDQVGTGLGLSISQHLVRAMGGEITVHSTPGRGSRFEFTLVLPLASLSAVDAGPVAGPQPPGGAGVDSPLGAGSGVDGSGMGATAGRPEGPPARRPMAADVAAKEAATEAATDDPAVVVVDAAPVDVLLPLAPVQPLQARHPIQPLPAAAASQPGAAVDQTLSAAAVAQAAEPAVHQSALPALATAGPDAALSPDQRLQPLTGRVLVAEENPVSRMLCVELLRTFGLRVQAVADDDAARRALVDTPVDLLIVDARLPGLQAAALLAAWRAARRADLPTPAIVLSDEPDGSLAAQDEWQRFAVAGFSGRLVRPCGPESLHAAIAGWLAPANATRAQATVD